MCNLATGNEKALNMRRRIHQQRGRTCISWGWTWNPYMRVRGPNSLAALPIIRIIGKKVATLFSSTLSATDESATRALNALRQAVARFHAVNQALDAQRVDVLECVGQQGVREVLEADRAQKAIDRQSSHRGAARVRGAG